MKKLRYVLCITTAYVLVASLFTYTFSKVFASSCEDILVVFARGSGQEQGIRENQKETYSFFDELQARKPNGVSIATRELVYPAIGAQSKFSGFPIWLNAEFPWNARGTYDTSLNTGIANLTSLLNEQVRNCPNQKFVLGGYSQGAQVVGDTLFQIGTNIKNHIAYVGLFGDPKFKADSYAARGNFLRRNGGILEPRKAEFPIDLMGRLQSWCKAGDGICENNFLVEVAPGNQTLHNTYPTHEIPIATNYAAQLLKQYFSGFNPKPIRQGTLADKVDIVYVVDTTATMQGVLGNVRANINAITNKTVALGGDTRIGLVQYNDTKDGCGTKHARTEIDLSNDATLLPARFANLFGECGGSPGDDTYGGLQLALDGQSWRSDARKVIILLAGNTPNNPDKFNLAATQASVIAAARALGVNIHGVIRGDGSPQIIAHLNLLGDTGGHGIFMKSGITSEFMKMYDEISKLLSLIPNLSIADLQTPKPARPGQAITFNGSNSHDPDGTIIQYEWDFNNDGIFDQTGTDGIVQHIYDLPYNGFVVLRAIAADGGRNYASTQISVSASNPILSKPNGPLNVLAAWNDDQSVTLSWQAPSNLILTTQAAQIPSLESYQIRNHQGQLLAIVGADKQSAKITNIPTNEAVSFTVGAVNSEGEGTATESNTLSVDDGPNDESDSVDSDTLSSSQVKYGGLVTVGTISLDSVLDSFLGNQSENSNAATIQAKTADITPSTNTAESPLRPTKLIWLLVTLPVILRTLPLIRLSRV